MSVTKLLSCDRWQAQGSYFGRRIYHGLYKTKTEGEIVELKYKIRACRREAERLEGILNAKLQRK